MAHNLNCNSAKNQFSFFSVKQKAWHGLGQIIEDHPTSAEALQFSGLNFTVEKRPLFTFDSENFHADPESDLIIPELKVPEYFATVRRDIDAVLGVVGKAYEVVQNVDAFRFFDSIVGGGDGIMYETAGALGKGERIFITAKLPNYIRVGKEDLIEQYLFLTTSHDGTGSITAAFTPIRIVCNNTLNAALSKHSNMIKIRHTANVKAQLEEAHKLMGIVTHRGNEFQELFNRWAKVRITDLEVKKLIQLAVIPRKELLDTVIQGNTDEMSTHYNNICNSAYEYAMSNPTQQVEATQGTLFGAYNAVTGYYQNVRHYKNEEAKIKCLILGGTGQEHVQAAFNLCREFEKRGVAALS